MKIQWPPPWGAWLAIHISASLISLSTSVWSFSKDTPEVPTRIFESLEKALTGSDVESTPIGLYLAQSGQDRQLDQAKKIVNEVRSGATTRALAIRKLRTVVFEFEESSAGEYDGVLVYAVVLRCMVLNLLILPISLTICLKLAGAEERREAEKI